MTQRGENEVGYWLIEPEATAALIANPVYHGFAETFLGWIAGEVSERLDLPSKSIRLEVIKANYQGAYPCLAASGELSDPAADEIECSIQNLLTETSLRDFLEAISSRHIATGQ
jgi:hypothetical protein